MIRFIKYILALIGALIMFALFVPISFLIGLVSATAGAFMHKSVTNITDFLKRSAVGLDELGNVACSYVFNYLLVKNNGFGQLGETCSSVIGKAYVSGQLTNFGKMIRWTLDHIQKDHCVKSIKK